MLVSSFIVCMPAFTDQETSDYYNSYGDVYAAIWGEQMHTGYFDVDKPLDQACRDMNVFLADGAGVAPGMTVLSVGCGRGGSDRFLASAKGVRVIGIDVSAKQLDEARRAAER